MSVNHIYVSVLQRKKYKKAYCVVGMEDVGGWGVVNDDDLVEVSS